MFSKQCSVHEPTKRSVEANSCWKFTTAWCWPMVHFYNFYSLKLFKTKDLSKSVNWWPMHMSIKCSSGKGVVLRGGVIPGRSAKG